MSSWFSKNLGDPTLASHALDRVEALFRSAVGPADCPAAMAIFLRHESEGRLHCEVKVYFSPSSAGIAKEVGAAPCGKPAKEGLSLLAGPRAAWSELFPQG